MKTYGRWESFFSRYDDKLSEEENYQKFFDYFNDPNHKSRSWVFEECELSDEIIKEEYDAEIKRLIDIGLIKPPISSFHLHYIGWKEWSHSKSVHPYWSSNHSIFKIPYPCDLPYEVQRSIKDYLKYSNNEQYKQSYRLRENMKELCHLYDSYKNSGPVTTVDMEEVQKFGDGADTFTVDMESVDWILPFDRLALKTKFDAGADTSPICYALSIKNLTEYLILQFENYVDEKADVLAELQKLSLPTELLPDVKKVRADLKQFNTDALSIYSLFTNAKDLQDLQNLSFAREEYYPPFSLVVEILTEKIRQILLRVELFEVMPDFVCGACAGEKDFSPQVKTASEIILDLVGYVLDGHFRQEIVKKTAAERVLEILKSYRASLENIQEEFKANDELTVKVEVVVEENKIADEPSHTAEENEELSHMEEKMRKEGKICKSKLKEIEEILTDGSEKRWLRINCIGKISG